MSNFDGKPVTAQGQNTKGLNVIAAGTNVQATADEDIAIVGLAATDIAMVCLQTQDGSADLSDLRAVCEADNLNIQATIAGSGVAIINYIVVRP